MTETEQAVTFDCEGETLIGIVSVPQRPSRTGVLIIVGGPQYRAGSHRQFVQLARRFADRGFPAMRFDYRGMGDSGGTLRSFEAVSEDIDAAIAAFRRACPGVNQIVLWGLCDAASAALLYLDRGGGTNPVGLVLANPWVRSQTTMAKAQVRHYYVKRLVQRQFWNKLLRGGIDPFRAAGDFVATAARATRASAPTAPRSFQQRMATGLSSFAGPVLVVLSGHDLTAREFEQYTESDPLWRHLLSSDRIERHHIEDADHTFSSARSRSAAETVTIEWLERRVATRVE